MFAGGRRLLGVLVRRTGLAWLLRTTAFNRRVAILLYHDPAVGDFERHMRYLEKRYNFVSLGTVVRAVTERRWDLLPARSLVVTIDDGLVGNFGLLDACRKYGVHPTLFLTTRIVDTLGRFWFTVPDGKATEALKRLPNSERLAALEAKHGFTPERKYDDSSRQALSREEIVEMGERFDFGSHTRFHPILPMCDDETAALEIGTSRAEVEAITGRPCLDFAYPNGSYGTREMRLVAEAGYRSARSVEAGFVSPDTDLYRLPIACVAEGSTLDALSAELVGLEVVSQAVKAYIHKWRERFDGWRGTNGGRKRSR